MCGVLSSNKGNENENIKTEEEKAKEAAEFLKEDPKIKWYIKNYVLCIKFVI